LARLMRKDTHRYTLQPIKIHFDLVPRAADPGFPLSTSCRCASFLIATSRADR
jgi:hypothetical protein